MKTALLTYLVCPLCHAQLDLAVGEQVNGAIESGSLTCRKRGHQFPIAQGIPKLLAEEFPGIDKKLGEARGWAEMARQDNWYAADERVDLTLPYVVEALGWDPQGAANWVATRVSFDHLLQQYVRAGMRVLEVGAAKSWAGRYFLARGCEYTATDLLDDPNIGLGRARFFTAHFGYYEVVTADAEQLPFADGYFDLVFAIAALHHALDLPKMLQEMARVAKPSGLVAGLNEAVRAFRTGAALASQSKEKSYGINEHVHTLWDYRRAFRRGGLHVLEMARGAGYDQLIAPRLKTGLNVVRRVPRIGQALAVWLLLGVIHPYDGVSIYAEKK